LIEIFNEKTLIDSDDENNGLVAKLIYIHCKAGCDRTGNICQNIYNMMKIQTFIIKLYEILLYFYI
jgi:protein tyrosine phosphatase